jgi:hypothetical protein
VTAERRRRFPAFALTPGNGDRWLALFLERLRERLRTATPGAAVLVEQWWDGIRGELGLLPFSPDLVLAMETLQEGIPLAWSRRWTDRAPEPPTGLLEEWFRVVVGEPSAPSTGSSVVLPPPVPPRIPEPLELDRPIETVPASWRLLPAGHPYWVATQTHWTVDSAGDLWTTSRGRFAAATPRALRALGPALAHHLRQRIPVEAASEVRLEGLPPRRRVRRQWSSGGRSMWAGARPCRLTRGLVGAAAPFPLPPDPTDDPRLRHAVVLGASGSGKTEALAHLTRQALVEGRSVVLFDVHGDLAPRVVAGLPPAIQDRLIGVDVTGAPATLPGLSVFGPVPAPDREALVAHLVAALKRLSTENGQTFWGFRLERLFESFLRLVQEQGGDLVDLWQLLTDAHRREAARLRTGQPDLTRFLEELEGIVRRQPDFLWPAASRVAKVVASPWLTALLAPRERALDVGARLQGGASVMWRLPIGELGPEGVTFAATLLLTRIYLEQVRCAPLSGGASDLRVLFVLDEAQLFPARLLTEIVAEGRKFGLGLLLATQYPARLAPELHEALTGAAGTVYLFRAPWASAGTTGAWVGLSPSGSERLLPSLPPGWSVVGATGPSADRRLVAWPRGPPADAAAWRSVVVRSQIEHGSPVSLTEEGDGRSAEAFEETLLLGLVAVQAEGGLATRDRLWRWLDAEQDFDPVVALETLEGLLRRGWIRTSDTGLMLTSAGADRVGLTARTGARPESAEHRALLVAALKIFARHHEWLGVLRQGRFDTRLPDGRVTVLPRDHGRWNPTALAAFLDRRRTEWFWRVFGGRDVHVEAEVSGATRRERIERDWTKARAADAFLLVLVSDGARARSVRRVLTRVGAGRNRAAVWTLPAARTAAAVSHAG